MVNIILNDSTGTAFGFNSDEVTDVYRDREFVKIYLPHSRIINIEARDPSQGFDIIASVWNNDKKMMFAVNRVWETIRTD